MPPIDFGLPTPNLFAPPSYEIDLGLGSFNDGLINTTPVISDQWWDSISSSISDAFLTTNVFDFSTDEFDVFDFETIQVPEVNIPPSSGLTFEDQATTFINLPTDYYISNQWNMALPQSQEIQGGEFGWMTGSYYEALTAPNYNFSAGEGYISDGQVDPYLQYASQNDGGYLMPVSQNGGGTLWNRFWANAPSAPQWLVDSVAGFGDGLSKTFTFGLVSTEDVRSWLGIGSVDTNSGAYTAGEVSGMVWASLTGVAGSANGGANTVLWSNGGLPGNAKTVAVEFGTTLEMTPLGRFLEGLQQKGVDIPMKVWEASSAIFAMNAKGEVSVVLGGINANSVLMRIELPILNARGVGFVIKP